VQLDFSILSWGAWTPACQAKSDWADWYRDQSRPGADNGQSPTLPHVPAMQRRRFSRLTKMMLEVAHQCEPPRQCRTIFASRHGELNRTLGLLEEVIHHSPLSPIGFSQSVHNTASGIFGIVCDNHSASTSVAAGADTLPQALTEAFAQLNADPTPLLLVFADEPVPDIYREYCQDAESPLALALVLAPANTTPLHLRLQRKRHADVRQPQADGKQLRYGDIIASLATGRHLSGPLNDWQWEMTHV
jgi:hypothetical protein